MPKHPPVIVDTYRITVPGRRYQNGPDRPARTVEVQVEIDIRAIAAELGGRASYAKGKRASALGGNVKVYHVATLEEA